MAFDTTILNLILGESFAAAIAALDSGHPTAFLNTIGAAVQRALTSRSTSGTSQAIGTGSKTFTLDTPLLLIAGTPVLILESGDPQANWMSGTLSADESSGDITVTVDVTSGSGTFTSWDVLVGRSSATVVTPPLGVVDGGTGGTTAATARTSLGVSRTHQLLSVESSPPGGETGGEIYLVGDAPTGAFAGHENHIATHNGASFDFTIATEGDRAYDKEANEEYLFVNSFLFSGGVWGNSKWKRATHGSVIDILYVGTTSKTLTVEDLRLEKLFRCDPTGAGGIITLTIPNGATSGVLGSVINVVNATGGYAVTINVSSGGLINGAASLSLPSQFDAARLIAGESGGGAPNWYSV